MQVILKKTLLSLCIATVMAGCGEKSENKSAAVPANEPEAEKLSTTVTSSKTQIEEQNAKNKVRMDNFKLPENTELTLWADSSQTQNPGYFSFDSKGRMLIAEIARVKKGVSDIRWYEDMTVADILIESNADRLKMYKDFSHHHPMSYYTETSDQIRLLEDKDKDGRAESSTIYAAGFNDALDGLGSGVIERDGKVYYTNIPHLWMLEDTDGDGVADERKSIQDGFGIRMSFFGHDMHGLAWGPDGKIYWSIGDRGYSFTTKEGKKFHGPNLGAVFRANADGSEVEVFYNTLRNPQELAFDDFGNLYTADNDGDGGDLERIDYLVEGGESGWHAGHQSIMSFTTRLNLRSYKYTGDTNIPNAWMTQDMWKPRNEKQPAFQLPAIGQINGGPSGLVYNPSVSFGDEWEDTFFVVHYKGAPAASYISSFKVEENGAGFTMLDNKEFIRGFNATDLDFGPDGRLYISEYNTTGWTPQDSGAIYALEYKGEKDQNAIDENEILLTADYSAKSVQELSDLLSRDHQQIRLKAQFELAKRGAEGINSFNKLATDTNASLIPRLHAVWGLGQIKNETQAGVEILEALRALLENDPEDQVRIQAARVLGDHKVESAAPSLIKALNDKHNRVAMYAAIGLGRISYADAVPALIEKIKANGEEDLFLRHGLVMALAGIDKMAWHSYKSDSSSAVRMAVMLAMRKHNNPALSHFLADSDKAIVDETIAAINDLQILEAREAGAKHLASYINANNSKLPKNAVDRFTHHRLINLNWDLGDEDSAKRILDYATTPGLHRRLVAEALAAIEGWNDLNPIDTTTGLPSKANSQRANIEALVKQALPKILEIASGRAMVQAMRIAEANGYEINSKILLGAVNDSANPASLRNQALDTLNNRKYSGLTKISSQLLNDKDAKVRAKALSTLMSLNKKLGTQAGLKFAQSDNTIDQQAGLNTLAKVDGAEIDKLIAKQMQSLLDKNFNPGAMLELVDAAKARSNAEVAAKLKTYQDSIANADIMTQFAGALEGGDAANGKVIFHAGGAAECLRCHVVKSKGGKVGPNLTRIADWKDNYYLLEALIDPSASIAPGYGSLTITDASGTAISGVFMGEDETTLKLKLSDGKTKKYVKAELKDIQRPMSGMPPMNLLLKPHELRDLVAYMSTLKSPNRKNKKAH